MTATKAKERAEQFILDRSIPDLGLLEIQEYFDWEVDEEEAIEIYNLVLEAKVEVSWG